MAPATSSHTGARWTAPTSPSSASATLPRDQLGFLIGQQIIRSAALETQRQAVQDDDFDRAQVRDAAREATLTWSRLDDDVRQERRIRCGDLESFDSRHRRLGLHDGFVALETERAVTRRAPAGPWGSSESGFADLGEGVAGVLATSER